MLHQWLKQSSTAVAPATIQYVPAGQPGNWRGKSDSASEYVIASSKSAARRFSWST